MARFRNWNAVDAWFRRGGAMKDRRSPRGGAKNTTSDYMEEYYEVSASEESSEAESDILADDDNGPVAQSG